MQIAPYLNEYKVIVNKSTVPVDTAAKIRHIIEECQSKTGKNTLNSVIARSEVCLPQRKQGKQSRIFSVIPTKAGIHFFSPSPFRGEGRVRVKDSFDVTSNLEFLREGSAVYDFTHPDKIVIGTTSDKALKIMQEIYHPLYLIDTPFVITNPETAELIKYAYNSILATKISFINEITNLCDKVGADVHQIAKAMGLDGRISPNFLHPGPGYGGGSCFPKDTKVLYHFASTYGYDFKLLKGAISANKHQREIMVDKIIHHLGNLKEKTFAILGLAFKQNTDDIRKSPTVDIIKLLLKEGAKIKYFDPLAMDNTKNFLPDLTYYQDEYETAQGSDTLVIAPEWKQFRNLDLLKIKKILKSHILLDLRNLQNPAALKSLGFI